MSSDRAGIVGNLGAGDLVANQTNQACINCHSIGATHRVFNIAIIFYSPLSLPSSTKMLASRSASLLASTSKVASTSSLAARAFSVSAAHQHAAPAPVPPKQKLKEFKIYRWVRTPLSSFSYHC